MLGFDVSVKSRVREVTWPSLTAADKLPTFFVLPGFSYLLLLDITLLLDFDIIFYHIVVDHIHTLMDLDLSHSLLVVTLANRYEVVLRRFFLVFEEGFVVHALATRMVAGHCLSKLII